ncbi:hypothetical protein [Duganella levis]|uniref:DUF302 domain-containing protein n=1 Tax=Duganella levis TaxID=2692169 RepID=A0ABW9VVJ0_9BURK|nr:hypothetical protein [Duganella levis]MYN25595.1 hypothetical protein [Duganella levis]
MSDDKFQEAVLKILKLTHFGDLSWTKATPSKKLTEGTDSTFPLYFEAEYLGRKLGLFQERRRRTPTEVYIAKQTVALTLVPTDVESKWVEIPCLALLDDDGAVAYSFASSREVRDLLETVRYRTSGVDQFLDELLKTEN